MSREAGVAPLLKWAGGKRWQVPRVATLYQAHTGARLVEPFCGGAAITLALDPARAVLNDVNPYLINLYQQIARGLRVKAVTITRSEDYIKLRDRFNRLIRTGRADTPEAARLFYCLMRSGFNGLCRFNQSGRFNTPWGRKNVVALSPDYAPRFARWTISCGSFETLTLEAGDFIYADPPYDDSFSQYAAGGFTWADQERLATWLAQHDGPVIATNLATERVLTLYRDLGFELEILEAPRRINPSGDRAPAREMFAIKNQR